MTAVTSGEANIRGIDIDKLAKGFADEEIIFKRFVTITNTSAREIRWYQKTAGYLESTAPANIENVAHLAQPFVLEQSWTRKTSYVRKYFVESPILSSEDIKDSDIDILATNIRDLTRAIAYQVDSRIWNVMTENQTPSDINEITISGGDEWDDATPGKIIDHLLDAKKKIRENGYNPEGAILFLSAHDHKSILTYLIDNKGASIPAFSSEKVRSGVVMELLGLRVVVSENVTTDYACVAQASRAITWKQFVPITARTVEEVGIGTKIRVWEEGEALLTDPKAVCLIQNTQA